MEKICTNCTKNKEINNFSKDKNRSDGYDLWCKECKNIYKKNYHHTKEGLATQLYVHQRYKSKRRDHTLPSYTKKDLKKWLFEHEKFPELFQNWENSNFDINYTPSVDRKNDYLPYSFDNIQLVTWKDNSDKFHKDEKSGTNRKRLVPVIAVKDTGEIIDFYSIAEASRKTGIYPSTIINICKNKKSFKSAKGYVWYYKNDYKNEN